MKPTTEQLEAYKAMAIAMAVPSMEEQIKANLEATCDKYKGNEDKFEGCIKYLTDTARELLDGNNGDVPDEVCFRICRDYFNDEIWLKEEAEKKVKESEETEDAQNGTESPEIKVPDHYGIKRAGTVDDGQLSLLDTMGV